MCAWRSEPHWTTAATRQTGSRRERMRRSETRQAATHSDQQAWGGINGTYGGGGLALVERLDGALALNGGGVRGRGRRAAAHAARGHVPDAAQHNTTTRGKDQRSEGTHPRDCASTQQIAASTQIRKQGCRRHCSRNLAKGVCGSQGRHSRLDVDGADGQRGQRGLARVRGGGRAGVRHGDAAALPNRIGQQPR